MEIQATKVFERNWDAIHELDEDGNRKYRYIINEGSSRSSKTWSLNQLIYLTLVSQQSKRITVWRKAKTDCRATVYRDFNNFLVDRDTYLYDTIRHNKTESAFYCNNSVIEFNGTDDHQKVHGLTQSIAWFNEVNEITKDVFDQIDQRTSDYILIDWNPSQAHWVDKLKKNPRTLLIHSTFRDNPFCPLESKLKILSYEPTAKNDLNGTSDKYMWEVYGLGIKAEKPNKIYHGWRKISRLEFDRLPYTSYYWLDFGETNPTAFGEIKYNDRNAWANELIYRPGKEIDSLIEELERLGIEKGVDLIICDDASPEKILELQIAGFYAVGANKGRVVDGISFVSKLNMHYTDTSHNIEDEYEGYEWEVDRYGLPTEKPIKKNDHHMDGIRYDLNYLKWYLEISI